MTRVEQNMQMDGGVLIERHWGKRRRQVQLGLIAKPLLTGQAVVQIEVAVRLLHCGYWWKIEQSLISMLAASALDDADFGLGSQLNSCASSVYREDKFGK